MNEFTGNSGPTGAINSINESFFLKTDSLVVAGRFLGVVRLVFPHFCYAAIYFRIAAVEY